MANFKLKTQIISSVFCVVGFIYHAIDLYSGYMSGKTVVNIKVETIVNQTLPAITICYPSYYSMKTLNRSDPIIQKLIQALFDFDTFMANDYNEAMSKVTNQAEHEKVLVVRDKEQEKIHRVKSEMTMVEYFDKFTLPYMFQGENFVVLLRLFDVIKDPDPIEFKEKIGVINNLS